MGPVRVLDSDQSRREKKRSIHQAYAPLETPYHSHVPACIGPPGRHSLCVGLWTIRMRISF